MKKFKDLNFFARFLNLKHVEGFCFGCTFIDKIVFELVILLSFSWIWIELVGYIQPIFRVIFRGSQEW